MCGIVGYLGENPEKILVENLKRLEYRGYDSAGIAVKNQNGVQVFKSKGEIKNLENIILPVSNANIGIGHTRWATHGKPDEINAHPHISSDKKWTLVHNGIIENYLNLKEKLIRKGFSFYSETDTEIIAKLLEYYARKDNDCLTILQKTCDALKGSYALGVMNSDNDKLYFAKNKSPLYIALNGSKVMLSSDIICFVGFSEEYYSVADGVTGFADISGIKFFDKLGEITVAPTKLDLSGYENLNSYRHYMLKEIYETRTAIKNIIEYYSYYENRNKFKGIDLTRIKKIKLVGCGTAYHAALMGAKMFEDILNIDSSACVASEFRYFTPKIGADTLVLLISQSGETADTLAALEIAKEKGALTVGLVNVEYSAIAKNSDVFFPNKAGVEIAVASTKAYSAQLVALNLISEILAENLGIKKFDMSETEKLYESFDFGNVNQYKLLADALRYNSQLFMIGRGADYYTALEASLKIKETSYISSDTYYAGELKHGFMALIDEATYVIVFATEEEVFDKVLSNAEEAKARGAKIILFTRFELDAVTKDNFFYVINVENVGGPLQSVVNIVPWQIIAYYTSVNKGINPDKPRNLAKSVTVE